MSPAHQTSSAPFTRGNTAQPSPAFVRLAVSDLADHPLLAHIPVWKRDEPEFAALLESVRERGLDYPVLIDSERRVIDGRNRRNVCAVLDREVECRQVADGEAASIIVASLLQRRHLTKGALAYLSAPLFSEVLEESKARNLAMLRQGGASVPHSAGNAPKTAEDVAAQVGVGHTLFEQALKLHRMFDQLPPEVRERYEPRVLGPWLDDAGDWQEPVGLGYMINGLTSLITEKAGKAKKLGKRAQHDRLFVGYLPKLRTHWAKATAEQRAEIATRLKTEVTKWPAELRDELAGAIRAAARADRE